MNAFLAGYMIAAPVLLEKLSSEQKPSPAHLDDIVRTILGEARGQGANEMKLVSDVIVNRAARSGRTPHQVVRRPKQFSFWNDPKHPNYRQTMAIKAADPQYQQARQLFLARYLPAGAAPQAPDWSGGATHYYNARHAKPKWGKGFTPIKRGPWKSTHVFGSVK